MIKDRIAGDKSAAQLEREAVLNAMHSCSLFQDWSRQIIAQLAPYFRLDCFAAGQIVVEEGAPGDFIGVVVEGKLIVRKFNSEDAQIELAKLFPGRLFGEMALLDGERRSATVAAIGAASVLVFTAKSLEKLAREEPPVALELVKKIAINLSKRLRSADGRLVDYLT